jgi:transposase
LKLDLTGGGAHDITMAETMVHEHRADAFLGDKGYDSAKFIGHLRGMKMEVVIPPRSNRNDLRDYDKELYKERNRVERFINKIKWFRRIFSRFDKLARRFLAFLQWVCVLIELRHA